jgi:hypothetical protein
MQTIGYWCDECRVKYVQHACKDRRLPCGHDFDGALRVYAKAYGRGGESVSIGEHRVWLSEAEDPASLGYLPGGRYYWETIATLDDGQHMELGRWLKSLGAKHTRAFEDRWQSCKRLPDWVELLRDEPLPLEPQK